ncbi:MAG TPA: J domain-containing protein [Devosiaceae bacterium]|nr:J domain-containing protein [Devosiaceae bacterium]
MARDPYEVLGVKKDATEEQIRSAFRRHAKKLHPDLNPGDKDAELKFKELNAANDLLSDPEKRGRFDRGEIDASGAERPQQRYYRDYAGTQAGGAENPYQNRAGFADFDTDIFADLFGGGRRGMGGRGNLRMRGNDVQYRLEVDFLDAVNGASKRITLGDGQSLEITIPPGTRDGQVLRLHGKGEPGFGEGEPGDALIEIAVRPHPFFTRDGDDIRLELPISIREAVLGGKVRVPTPTGAVVATVPKASSSGKVLRLKGRGVPRRDGQRGDLYARLLIVLPERPDPALEQAIAAWPGDPNDNPRKALGV